MSTGVKAIKGGKTENEPTVVTRKMRGVTYTIRELTVPEYKECLKDAQRDDGVTPFGDLLDLMVLRSVTPNLASLSKPLPYPIYRTLEGIVNDMHFQDVPEDKEEDETEAAEESEELAAAPNS